MERERIINVRHPLHHQALNLPPQDVMLAFRWAAVAAANPVILALDNIDLLATHSLCLCLYYLKWMSWSSWAPWVGFEQLLGILAASSTPWESFPKVSRLLVSSLSPPRQKNNSKETKEQELLLLPKSRELAGWSLQLLGRK